MTQSRPIPAVDAATVILVRHGIPLGSPWQCFMVRRPVRSEFAADVFVFPGGKVDATDVDPALEQFTLFHKGFSSADVAGERAVRVAAVRESFEEVGVLLAQTDEGAMIQFEPENRERFEVYRRMLRNRTMTMLDLARKEQLIYALDRLHLFSRWVTPETMPRRYDTRFYVAYLPSGQSPLHDAEETVDSVWVAPGDALHRAAAHDFPLVFATEKHLEYLARFRSIEELTASTAGETREPVMPQIVQRGGDTVYLLPGDPGYQV